MSESRAQFTGVAHCLHNAFHIHISRSANYFSHVLRLHCVALRLRWSAPSRSKHLGRCMHACRKQLPAPCPHGTASFFFDLQQRKVISQLYFKMLQPDEAE